MSACACPLPPNRVGDSAPLTLLFPKRRPRGPCAGLRCPSTEAPGWAGGAAPGPRPPGPPRVRPRGGHRLRRRVCVKVRAHGPEPQAPRRDPRRGHPLCGPRSDRCPPTVLQPPATPWWRSTSAGAWARTTRSQSRPPTPCPSRAPWTTISPRPWATRGFRSRQPRTARPAAPSRPRAGASPPAPRPTWSATAIPRPWSPEGGAALRHHVHLHGLPEL